MLIYPPFSTLPPAKSCVFCLITLMETMPVYLSVLQLNGCTSPVINLLPCGALLPTECHADHPPVLPVPPIPLPSQGVTFCLPLSPPLHPSHPSLSLIGCHDPQHSGACQTYFPWPRTRCVDPGSILAEQRTMPDEATKVGMWNTDAHVCAPSPFSSQCVYIYLTSTGNFPSLEIN